MTNIEATRRTNHSFFRALAVLVALAVAASLLTAARPAQAAFPGLNGKIVFAGGLDNYDAEIYTMNSADGTDQINLTDGAIGGIAPDWAPGFLVIPPF